LGLLGVSTVLLGAGPAQAQSVYDVLRFNEQARPASQFVPLSPPSSFEVIEPQRPRRVPRTFREEDWVGPPKPVMPAKAKPAKEATPKEIVASLMSDPTLQPGDIVVFPNGPRVFRGHGGSRHRARDFEDLRASRLVDNATRRTVLASTRTTYAQSTTVASTKPQPQRPVQGTDVEVTGAIAVKASTR
jgi:hypothetical protein